VEDQDISIGDEFYIMGPTTGVIEGKLEKLLVENEINPLIRRDSYQRR